MLKKNWKLQYVIIQLMFSSNCKFQKINLSVLNGIFLRYNQKRTMTSGTCYKLYHITYQNMRMLIV